jgi:hypothetical protein
MQPQQSNQNSPEQPAQPADTASLDTASSPTQVPENSQAPEQVNAPAAGQVFSPGAAAPTQASITPSINQPAPSSLQQNVATSPSSQTMVSGSSIQEKEQKNKKWYKPSKKIALILALPLLFIGGGASAYLGYYVPNKPENVWNTALTNTGKGYDKLSQYATAKKDVKDMSAKGSFKISGSVAADGSFNGASDGKNGQLTGTTSAVGLKINYDVRTIDSPGNTPDVYFKIDGIQGLGELAADYAVPLGGDGSSVKKALNGLNGQWYFVDHTLFDQLAKSSNTSLQISSNDVSSALKAVGDSSKQYLFTDNPDKAAITVKQYVGKDTQDGRKTYHYKVGVNKENLKAYNKSLCDNLIKTKLFKLFSQNGVGDEDFSKECFDSTGIDKIKDSQTADVWVDLHTKLIHKVRIAEESNSNNYTDIIQDYQGGNELPFSIATHTQEKVDSSIYSGASASSKPHTTSGQIKMKLNMKTNTFIADATFEDSGSTTNKGTFNLILAPSNQPVKVEKPAGAKTIIELMNDLGFSDMVSGNQSSAKDAKRKTDINALATQMEVYYSDNGYYPTLNNVNDANWRKTNMKGFDDNALKDPDGTQAKLSGSPAAKVYAYQAAPANCTGTNCTSYVLTAILDNGSSYTKQSLN